MCKTTHIRTTRDGSLVRAITAVFQDDGEHPVEIDWLGSDVNGSEILRVALAIAEGAEDHDRNACELLFGKALLLLAEAPTIHNGQRQIEEYQAWTGARATR